MRPSPHFVGGHNVSLTWCDAVEYHSVLASGMADRGRIRRTVELLRAFLLVKGSAERRFPEQGASGMPNPTGLWSKSGWMAAVMSAVAISFWLQHATPAGPRDRATGVLSRDTVSTADRPKELQRFIPVDTSRLMGSPDPIPPMKVEVAFPRLKIARPVQPTHAGDDSNRMFVVTQRGLVYVIPNRADVRKADVFLDLRKVVSPGNGDNGLLGIAFHPQYRSNGEFFVVYTTRARPQSTIVSRFRVSKDNRNRAARDSEQVLLKVRQPLPDHNAACLQFGPDGYLYIALGDGGYHPENGHAQDLSSLLGKMLRIDVNRKENGLPYAIPRDKPFVGRWPACAVAVFVRPRQLRLLAGRQRPKHAGRDQSHRVWRQLRMDRT